MANDTHILARLSWHGSARHLAAIRIAVGLVAASALWSPALQFITDLGVVPSSLTDTIFPPVVEQFARNNVTSLLWVGRIAAVFAVLGVFTRIALPMLLAALLLTENTYYRLLHFHDVWPYLWFFLLVLCFAPCTDAWSLEALWRAERQPLRERPERHQRYRWPVELMVAWATLLYVAAGLAKLLPLRKGVIWLEGGTIQHMVGERLFDSPLYWLLGRPAFDYTLDWPFAVIAWFTIIVEVGVGVVLLTGKLHRWVGIGIVMLHVGIYFFGVPGFVVTGVVVALLLWPSGRRPDAATQPSTAALADASEDASASPDRFSGSPLAAR